MNKRNFSFWHAVFKNELLFSLIQQRRYLFDTISGFVIIYVMFLVIFFGLNYFAGEQVNEGRLDTIIVGYIMWMFAINAYTSTSTFILMEAQQGTLEQVFMSPAGFHKLLFVRLIVSFFVSLIFNGCLLVAAMLTAGRWLAIPYGQIIFLLAIALPSVYGLGYIIAGLAILFKKISSATGVLQFGLIALISLTAYPLNAFSLLPFSAGANTINRIIVAGESFPLWWYGFIAGNSIVYFLLGIFVFKIFVEKAMKRNVLGHY